jgi:hypothetical protein
VDLAKEREQWEALVSTVMKPWVSEKNGNFSITWENNSFSSTLLHGTDYSVHTSFENWQPLFPTSKFHILFNDNFVFLFVLCTIILMV